MVGIHQLPLVAAVIGAIEAAILGFNERVDAVGIRSHCDADAAVRLLRKALAFHFFPRCAIVVGAVDSAAWTTAGQGPGLASSLP